MVVFVISFVTSLQIWISAGHVPEIITMKDLKDNRRIYIILSKDRTKDGRLPSFVHLF